MLNVPAAMRRFLAGLRALVSRSHADRELDDELRVFLEQAADDRMRDGTTHDDATRAARLRHGLSDSVREAVQDVGWESAVESAWQDVRYAARSLRKAPGFTAAAVITLALGIGATTAIFSLLDAVLLRPLPVRDPGALVLVRSGGQYPTFQAFRQRRDVFESLLATSGVTRLDVEIDGGPRERADVSLVSGSYFATLGVPAAAGRTFGEDEDRVPGAHPVAVISHGYWERRLGRDPAAINRVIRVSGTPVTIVGVTPPRFFGEEVGVAPDLWMPLTMWGRVVPGRNLLERDGTSWLVMIGRVRAGVEVSGVHPGLTQLFQQVVTDIFGPSAAEDVRREIAQATVALEPVSTGVSGLRTEFGRPLQLLLGAVALVLLIACANIANLLLARATARRREVDVRLALGMSRARLMRQLLVESVLLAAIGGAAGVVVASAGREALLRLISADGSRVALEVTTDLRLLGFVTAISMATAVLFGLAPAWRSARSSLTSSLVVRQGRLPRRRLSSLLVVGQVAVSLVLLVGAALFLRTIANLRDVDLGFAAEHLLIVDVAPQAAGYAGERTIGVVRRLVDRLAAMPGVTTVSVAENGLLMGRDSSTNLMHPEGTAAGPDGFARMQWDVVGPRYFAAVGTTLLAGRDFTDRDTAGAPNVIAINEEAARRLFSGVSPVGRRMRWGDDESSKAFEIVAVARDVKHDGPRDAPEMRFYLPYYQLPQVRPDWALASVRLLVRSVSDPGRLAAAARDGVMAIDPRLSIERIDAGPDLVSRTLVRERAVATLLVVFGLLAAGLACLGLYGLIAYQVAQRTGEIGIRMALGAGRGDVLRSTLAGAAGWIVAGLGLGVPLALAAARTAESLLFGLNALDPGALAAAVAIMAALGVAAAYLPARRASRVDPLVALRHE